MKMRINEFFFCWVLVLFEWTGAYCQPAQYRDMILRDTQMMTSIRRRTCISPLSLLFFLHCFIEYRKKKVTEYEDKCIGVILRGAPEKKGSSKTVGKKMRSGTCPNPDPYWLYRMICLGVSHGVSHNNGPASLHVNHEKFFSFPITRSCNVVIGMKKMILTLQITLHYAEQMSVTHNECVSLDMRIMKIRDTPDYDVTSEERLFFFSHQQILSLHNVLLVYYHPSIDHFSFSSAVLLSHLVSKVEMKYTSVITVWYSETRHDVVFRSIGFFFFSSFYKKKNQEKTKIIYI